MKTTKTNIKQRMRELLDNGLNDAQEEIVARLLASSEIGTEGSLALYVRSMDRAASLWAQNHTLLL